MDKKGQDGPKKRQLHCPSQSNLWSKGCEVGGEQEDMAESVRAEEESPGKLGARCSMAFLISGLGGFG